MGARLQRSGTRRLGFGALVVALLCLGTPEPSASQRIPKREASDWYFLTEADGVRVYARDRADQTLPITRGIGEVGADFFTIAALLADAPRHCEWMVHCIRSELVTRAGDMDQLFYTQFRAPWPVLNRDLVFRTHGEYRPRHGEMLVRFGAARHPTEPPRDDFVRMPRLDGFYHLRAITAERTAVTLQVDADPGGLLPDWLVKVATRSYPLDTLRNLRQQLERTRGVYAAQVQRLRAAHGDYAMSKPPAAPARAEPPTKRGAAETR